MPRSLSYLIAFTIINLTCLAPLGRSNVGSFFGGAAAFSPVALVSSVAGTCKPIMSTKANNKADESESEGETLLIQVVSDLHIEFYEHILKVPDKIQPQAPILALLGDIGLACTDLLQDFLFLQADRFEKVLFLPGNHEYYNSRDTTYSMEEQMDWMKEVCSRRENLYFMDRDSLLLNGVLVLGTTLWSDIPDEMLRKAEQSMNDYEVSYNHKSKLGEAPRRLRADETRREHETSVAWIRSKLADAKKDGRKVVVLTHHTPLMSGTSHPMYEGGDLTCCFSTSLKSLIIFSAPTLVAWACGHTHYNFDFMVGNVRVCSNQRGYKGQPNRDFDKSGLIIEVDSK